MPVTSKHIEENGKRIKRVTGNLYDPHRTIQQTAERIEADIHAAITIGLIPSMEWHVVVWASELDEPIIKVAIDRISENVLNTWGADGQQLFGPAFYHITEVLQQIGESYQQWDEDPELDCTTNINFIYVAIPGDLYSQQVADYREQD